MGLFIKIDQLKTRGASYHIWTQFIVPPMQLQRNQQLMPTEAPNRSDANPTNNIQGLNLKQK